MKWNRSIWAGLAAGALIGIAWGYSACGGGSSGSVCGNGILESGELCDDGNTIDNDQCSNSCIPNVAATTSVTVHWPINQGRFNGMPGEVDSCTDVGATQAVVTFVGPTNFSKTIECNLGQQRFLDPDVKPGNYEVRVKLVRHTGADSGAATDTDLTHEVPVTFSLADRQRQDVSVKFAISDFLMGYTGNLQFRSSWGPSMTCAGAQPAVDHEELLLKKADGTVITKMSFNDPATALNESVITDGSAPGLCVDASANVSQLVADLDWGDYTLAIKGMSSGQTTFCATFPVFVGAQSLSSTNPSYQLTVPAFGIGVADASVPDGGMDGGSSQNCF